MTIPPPPQSRPNPFEQAPDIRTRAFEEGSINPDGTIGNVDLLTRDDLKALEILGVEVEGVPEDTIVETEEPTTAHEQHTESVNNVPVESQTQDNFMRIVEAASQTVFVDGTNLPLDSEDAAFIQAHPEFPIPTWESTLDPMTIPGSINIADRFRQRIWGAAVDSYEVFNDTRANESKLNKAAMEKLNNLQSTGDDSQIRALFAVETSSGVFVNPYTGKHVEAVLVRDARKMFGENHHDFQAAWWYELINKAQNEGDFTIAMNRGLEIMNAAMARKGPGEGPRWTESQVMGTLKGLEFMGKSQHLSFKHANIVWNEDGQLQYKGINGPDLMRELTGKFQGYTVGGLSGVDASNLAILAESSLQVSIDYARLPPTDPDRPSEQAKKNAQFVLQRFAKQISDMRMGLSAAPEGASAEEQAQRQAAVDELAAKLSKEPDFLVGAKGVYIDMETGKLVLPRTEKIRTGGAAITASIWEQIAVYSDIATTVFPNLKYMSRDEMSPVDAVIQEELEEYLDAEPHAEDETNEAYEKRVNSYKKRIASRAVGLEPLKDEYKAYGKLSAKEKRKRNREAQMLNRRVVKS